MKKMKLKIVAHRGGTGDPKYANQLETFLNSGAAAWETDLHLTLDGKVILLHDNTLRNRVVAHRLENKLSAEERELLDQDASMLTYEQIRKHTDGHINTLDELLGKLPAGVELLLEIKGSDPAIVRKIKECLSGLNSPNILFICFCVAVIKELKASGLKNSVFLLTRASALTDGDINLRCLDDLSKVKEIISENKLEGVGIEYARNEKDVRTIVKDLRAFKPGIQIQFWVHKENETEDLFKLAEELDVDYCNSDEPKARSVKQKAAK